MLVTENVAGFKFARVLGYDDPSATKLIGLPVKTSPKVGK
jgi:hypothetical protein